MDARYTHEVAIGADLADGVERSGADGHDGVLEQASADQHDLDAWMLDEFDGDRGTVGDYRGRERVRQLTSDLLAGGAAVEEDDLS